MQEQSKVMLTSVADFLVYIKQIASQISARAVNQCNNLETLFQGQSEADIILTFPTWTYHIQNPTSSPFCSKSFANSVNKKAFRCFDCMQIDTALFCYDCFVRSNHKGHTFRELQAAGGCCDCGDSQLWNKNGFCPDHSAINKNVNIKNDIRQLFLKELKLIFYIYFWCAENSESISLSRQLFGTTLLDFIYKLAQKNYETKLLIAELMNSSLQEKYRPLLNIRKTILSTIFNLPKEFQELAKMQSIAFQMYSVEDFRACILSEYFKLNMTNTFTWDHPIKNFNFQYLTCIKAINKLIAQQVIEPLHLSPCIPFKNIEQMVSVFKKYYEDLNYLRKMKESKEYNLYHFAKILANDMAFYRSRSRMDQKEEVVLDDYFLKSIATSMQHIIDRTDILVKNIQSLFGFVVNFNTMTYSLAQQRAFAMFIMAYLKGNLEKLLQKDVQIEILGILNIKPHQIKEVFQNLIRKHLKNVTKLIVLKPKAQKNSYQKFFFSVYTEKEYPLQLDFIYQKILMILTKDHLNYWDSVNIVCLELKEQKENALRLLSELSLFIANLFTQELNELAVANSIGLPRSQQIVQFYLKILTAYAGKFNVRELKCLSGHFINNPQILQEALQNHTALQRSRMIVNAKVQPFGKLVYINMIKEYKFYEDVRWVNHERLRPVPLLRDFPAISQDVLHLQCKNTMNILKILSQSNQNTHVRTLEKQVSALLQLYLLTQAQTLKQFFNNKLPELKVHLHPEIINHLKEVCKDKAEVMDQIANQEKYKEDQHKRKREKIENKKREKQLMMKKNQEAMLKQYNAIQEMVSENETCIYCRQDIKQDYHLLSYVSLTNLISKFMIKDNSNIHFFLTTCGHKVHEECYNKYVADKAKEEKCPYCKKRTNICLQNISNTSDLSEEQRQKIVSVFFDSICATLMEEYTQLWDIYEQFYEKQHQGNILSTIITSLAREVIYYGLHNFNSFKKYSLPAYLSTFRILSLAKKQQLKESFAIIQDNRSKNKHILAILESYAYEILKNKLLNSQIYGQVDLEQTMTTEVQKIISLITTPKESNIQISNLTIITKQSLFWAVPQSIKELHTLMQQCPICGKLTNWIYICLICSWKACNKENKAFHQHSKQQHTDGSVFISAGNGKISLVNSGQVKNEDSYFENMHGESYSHNDENSKKGYSSSFRLSQEKMTKIFKDIISHNLHNIVIS